MSPKIKAVILGYSYGGNLVTSMDYFGIDDLGKYLNVEDSYSSIESYTIQGAFLKPSFLAEFMTYE